MLRSCIAGIAAALIIATPAQAQSATSGFAVAVPTPGSWSYAPGADGGEAAFRDSTGRSQLIVRCTRSQRRLTIAKPASGAAAALNVITTSGEKSIASSFDPATGLLSAYLTAFDPFADAIAFTRGRLGAAVAGGPTLVAPAWPEVARVIENCRI